MNNEIYRRIYKDSNQTDGETPSTIIVTEESNGYAVWEDDWQKGTELLHYFKCLYEREKALEYGVETYLMRKGK